MRVAVVGGTGQIGSHALAALQRLGHEGRPISRSTGTDVYLGEGLVDSLVDVEVVVDVINNRSQDEAEAVDFFTTTTQNLLQAERAAGVSHHVLLSVVGIENGQRAAHYSGKRAQETLVASGPIPWSIVRSTQFYELPGRVVTLAAREGVAKIAPLLVQPIAPSDVASILVEVAVGVPLTTRIDIAGPETHDFVDMARRILAARGQEITLEPTWQGMFDASMAGEVMLPGPSARIALTTFEEWLATDEARATGVPPIPA